jgi:hypothetical protein
LAAIGAVLAGIAGLFAYAGGWLTPGTLTPHRWSTRSRRWADDALKIPDSNAWQHVHLIGAFDFEKTESQIDIDALAARYDDPDFWNRALLEVPDDSLT